MTPQEELELINIELELRRRNAGGGAVPLGANIPAQEKDIFGRPMLPKTDRRGMAADLVATGITAVPRAVAGLIDLTTLGKQKLNTASEGKLFPGVEKFPRLTPYVDAARDEMAGRPVERSLPATIVDAGVSSAAFPASFAGRVGNTLSGITGGVTTEAASQAGAPWWVSVPLGMATTVTTSMGVPGVVQHQLAKNRVNRALRGVNQQDLDAGMRAQAEATKRSLPLFPSQAMPSEAPGFAQLETEAIRSQARSAAGLQQKAFSQAPLSAWYTNSILGKTLPRSRDPLEQTANALQDAAVKRGLADSAKVNARTEELYKKAGASTAEMPKVGDPAKDQPGIDDVFAAIDAKLKSPTTPKEQKDQLREIYNQLANETQKASRDQLEKMPSLIAAKEAQLAKAADPAAQAKLGAELKALQQQEANLKKNVRPLTAPWMHTLYGDATAGLAKRDPAGIPVVSDNNAKEIRELLEKTLRKGYEKVEPMYELARTLQASGKSAIGRGPFDQLTNLAAGKGDAADYLLQVPQSGDALQEIAKGVMVRGGKRVPAPTATNPNATKAVPIASNREAVRDALAAGLDLQRQKSFGLTAEGLLPQAAPGRFVQSIAGTPEAKEQLTRSLLAAGVKKGDVDQLFADLEVVRNTGRPTVVHGTRVPETGFSPVDIARATIGGSLQQQQAQMSLFKTYLNRLSDAQVAKLLEQPNSIELMRSMPGALSALEPREALARALAAQLAAGATER